MRKKLLFDEQLIVDAYNNGLTLREIGDFHKVSYITVRRVLMEKGIPMRPRGRKKKEK